MNLFDLHSDTPYECYKNNILPSDRRLAANIKQKKFFDKWDQFYAVWIKDDETEPFKKYKDIITFFKEKLKNTDIKPNIRFALEGGAAIGEDIENIYKLKEDNIEYITLTWNHKNNIAAGTYESGGITDFGKKVINKMNDLSIACDLSHSNDETFYKALEISKYPIITHACLKDITDHPRNFTFSQIKELFKRGGIFGICFYPEFAGEGDIFEKIYENIYRLSDLGFAENLAIGSDFDGALMDKNLKNSCDTLNLYDYLLKKGIDKKSLDGIFYDNAFNYFKKLSERKKK